LALSEFKTEERSVMSERADNGIKIRNEIRKNTGDIYSGSVGF